MVAVALILVLAAAFRRALRPVASAFAEQDRLRRQLMADVAHELRTLLSILQGCIEGLLDGVYPRDEAHLAELLDETRHLSRLVEDIGTLAHAEAGALELRKEAIDLGDLIRDVAAALPRPIVVEVPADLPVLEADPVRIRQVLLNLLANALRYRPAEGVIAVEVQEPQRMLIRVRDTGSGIAPRSYRAFSSASKGERLTRLRSRPRHRPQAGAGARRRHRNRERTGAGHRGHGLAAAVTCAPYP